MAGVCCVLARTETRLLTLIGPGGVGKTRLAVAVARRSRGSFDDGALFVSLAPLRDPGLAPSALAESLGIRDAGDGPLPSRRKTR